LILKKNRGFQGPPRRKVSNVVQQKLQQALALHQKGMLSDAKEIYDEILKQKPDYFDALHLLGVIAYQTKNLHQAEELIGKAIKVNPNNAAAYSNRGTALKDLKRFDEAIASYDKAIALKPDFAEAYSNRGTALKDLKRLDEAIASYDKAIALKPDFAEAYSNRGITLKDLKRFDEAIASYEKAIALKPDFAEAYYNRGNALQDLKRLDEAITSYDKAIALKPDYAEAYNNRGSALKDLKRYDEAFAAYDKALALKSDLVGTEAARLYTKMHLCDWINFDTECAHLTSSVKSKKANAHPFAYLGISSSPDDQLQCAKLWVAEKCPPSKKQIWQGERYRHDRIRVAYVSADFRQHPGAYLMAGLFEQHDRSRFEITGVSFGVDDRSEIRKRLVAAFDEFYDVRRKSDQEVAKLLYELQVDIAIDRNGYTRDSRSGIFAHRPAPIQVSYLGFPATMGTPFIDYIIADKVIAPFEHQQFYTEKIVHLPDCYQVNDSKRKIAKSTPTRQEMGLPEHAFVFCCFNNNWKITPAIFDIWMRLLHQVEGSVLWLLWDNEGAERNLREEAQRRGIDPLRLVFAGRLALDEHLARHRLADLFLDTLPYNAHTTASDALWVGLPVLTCKGEAFAGRVAASLLHAVGVPELITSNLEDYQTLALKLARDPALLAEIKANLVHNRNTYPLFNTERFARHIEAAYTTMWETCQRSEKPKSFSVEDR
jgi:protein O-GlcNAc transferase